MKGLLDNLIKRMLLAKKKKSVKSFYHASLQFLQRLAKNSKLRNRIAQSKSNRDRINHEALVLIASWINLI